jgi:hypothetical protein
VKPEDFGTILKRVHAGSNDEDYTELVRVLTAANAAVRKSDIFTEHGRGGSQSAGGGANEIIEKRTTELMKAEKLPYDKALSRVFAEDPALYNTYLKGVAFGQGADDRTDS